MAKEKKVNERWEKTRLMGRKRFIWRVGVLEFGMWMFIILGIIFPLMSHETLVPLRLLRMLILSGIGGWLWGFLMWHISEKQR